MDCRLYGFKLLATQNKSIFILENTPEDAIRRLAAILVKHSEL